MSTSSQSSASVVTGTASAFDVNRSPDDLIYSKHCLHHQQQQQHQMTSSPTQRFHPYLVTSYGKDSASSTLSIDRDLVRSSVVHMTAERQQAQSIAVDSSFSGRLQDQSQAATSSSSSASAAAAAARRLREFIPNHKKDNEYWMKRQKNNEAAKRSREKRRINDMVMMKKILELTNENKHLKMELSAIKQKYGLLPEMLYPPLHGGDTTSSQNQSVSPVCLGISSSDDSTSPSSYARHHSTSRSSPSPPILDQCHMDSVTNRSTPDAAMASLFRVTGTSQPYQEQPIESYRQPLFTGQQFVFDWPSEQQQAKVISLAEAGALFGPLQCSSTSNIPPVKNLCVRLELLPREINSGMNENVSSYVTPSTTTSTTITGSIISSSSISGSRSSLLQNHPLGIGATRVALCAPELPSLIFSDLSSSSSDDDFAEELSGNMRHNTASVNEAPLNLTKRFHPWPLVHSSLVSSVVKLDPISTLRKNHESFLSKEEMMPCTSEFPVSNELSKWSTAGSIRAQDKMLSRETTSEVDVQKLLLGPGKSNITLVNRIGECGMKLAKNVDWQEGRDEIKSDMFTEFIVDPLLASTVQAPSRQVRGGVPLKVWHKQSVREVSFEMDDCLENPETSGSRFSANQFPCGPAPEALSRDQICSSPSSSNINNSSENDCVEYKERRIQNNFQTRNCRENQKLRTGMNLTAATILKSENHLLKEELRNLSKEVTNLKERIDRNEQQTHNGTSIVEST